MYQDTMSMGRILVYNNFSDRGSRTVHLRVCPGLNTSIVQLVLHIWQGYLTFSYYFIFDIIVSVLVTVD